jgi:hypothetical protein
MPMAILPKSLSMIIWSNGKSTDYYKGSTILCMRKSERESGDTRTEAQYHLY